MLHLDTWTLNLPQISSAALSKLSASSRSGSGQRMSSVCATPSPPWRINEPSRTSLAGWAGFSSTNFSWLDGLPLTVEASQEPLQLDGYDSRGRRAESGPRRSTSFILIVTSWVTWMELNYLEILSYPVEKLLFNNSFLGKACSFIFIAK